MSCFKDTRRSLLQFLHTSHAKGFDPERRVRGAARRMAVLFVIVLGCSIVVKAQVATGDILGTVTDTSGAAVPNATVMLTNVGTGAVAQANSAGDGAYSFTQLQPGKYRLSIAMPGFKAFAADNVVLQATDRARIDAQLQIGATTETVEVTTAVSALQTDSTNVGSSIEATAISDIPLNGRNVYNLVQVAPGVNPGNPTSLTSGTRPDDRRQSSSVSANGQYELVNNQVIDGLDNNERYKGLLLIRPSVEAIQQVRVDTNLYTAEVGRTAGASITILTKSGTNDLHGSVYEFFRNDITDARNFFARASTLPRKPELRQNQFGGSLGGAIRKDKTFFFVDYEQLRQIDATGTVVQSTVPTLFERQNPGDLTDQGGPKTAVLDPTALAYFKLYPAPNQAGTAGTPGVSGPTNNFLYDPSRVQNTALGDLRIDQHFSPTDLLFGRFSYNQVSTFVPGQLPAASAAANSVQAGGTTAGQFPGTSNILVDNFQLNYTHTFSPNLVMELRTGYTFLQDNVTALNFGTNLNDQGQPYAIPNANTCLDCSGLAPITPGTGYAALGDANFLPILLNEHTYQYAGSLTYVRGTNTLRVGGALVRRIVSNLQQNFGKPTITFTVPRGTTSTPLNTLTSFFKGAPFTYQRQGLTFRPHVRTTEPSGFVQDDWRVRPNLTLNLGLRYDVFTTPNEETGNFSLLDLSTGTLRTSATAGVQTSYVNVAPRLGFAFTPKPNLVIRGGIGMTFYASDIQNAFYALNPPYAFSTGVVASVNPVSTGVVNVAAQSATALTGSITAKPFNFHDAYVEQFNLLVQKDFAGNVVTVGYVGELGRHLETNIPNLQNPNPNGTAAVPTQVYAGLLPNVNTINFYGDEAISSYHSLQTSYERRLRSGLTLNANYTLAHALDDTNNNGTDGEVAYGLEPTHINTYDYGNSFLDVRSRVAVTANYAIAYKGKGVIGRLAFQGWQVNGLSFWQTGTPISISSAVTQGGLAQINLKAVTVDRPNLIASPFLANPDPIRGYFNSQAFARQQLGTAGNAGRNQIHGPHQRRTDLSLFKTFPIHEKIAAQFRAECFNIANTPNFALPVGQITAYNAKPDGNGNFTPTTSSNFGKSIATTAGLAARQFQFALKLTF